MKRDYESEVAFYRDEINNPQWINSRVMNDGILDYPQWMNHYEGASVLEIGCGPCSSLYYGMKHNKITTTCVDALADVYREVLGGKMFHPIIQGVGEDIDTIVHNSFDIVFMQNSLDHMSEPLIVIEKCLKLLNLNGLLHICGFVNEGIKNNYEGLHQHNFFLLNDELMYTNKQAQPPINIRMKFNLDVIDVGACGVRSQDWFYITFRCI